MREKWHIRGFVKVRRYGGHRQDGFRHKVADLRACAGVETISYTDMTTTHTRCHSAWTSTPSASNTSKKELRDHFTPYGHKNR